MSQVIHRSVNVLFNSLIPQGADEAALHGWPMWTDAEDFQRVCPTAGLPWRVSVHEGPAAAQYRLAFLPVSRRATPHFLPHWYKWHVAMLNHKAAIILIQHWSQMLKGQTIVALFQLTVMQLFQIRIKFSSAYIGRCRFVVSTAVSFNET